MTEQPIIFTHHIDRLIDRTKTQTRRTIHPQPKWDAEVTHTRVIGPLAFPIGALGQQCGGPLFVDGRKDGVFHIRNPYGGPDSRLWVKEPYRLDGLRYLYRDGALTGQWSNPMFMPREACRLRLRVTEVRVERVQAISEADAIAEGIERDTSVFLHAGWKLYGQTENMTTSPIESYRSLWDSINAGRNKGVFAWQHNPWVWVLTTEVIP
jgi:hypothetical protein